MNDEKININDRIRQLLNKAILLLLLINISIFAADAQQDPQFSQNRFNQLTVNPGFAGSSGLKFFITKQISMGGIPRRPGYNRFQCRCSSPYNREE